MDFFASIDYYTLAIALALILVGLMCRPASKKQAYSYISLLSIEPESEGEDERVEVAMQPNGKLRIVRHGLRLREGDTVNLATDVIGDKVVVKEKKGVESMAGIESSYKGSAEIGFLARGKYAVRYESEVTGKWCTFTVIAAEDFSIKSIMKY